MWPVWQAIEDAATRRTENSRGSALVERRLTGPRRPDRNHATNGDVAVQFGLGHARLLKVQYVMKLTLRRRLHQLGWLQRHPRQNRGVDSNDPFDALWRHQRRVPGDRATPVVADNHALGEAERIEQADYVRNQLLLGVHFDWLAARPFHHNRVDPAR